MESSLGTPYGQNGVYQSHGVDLHRVLTPYLQLILARKNGRRFSVCH
jgi:hypothetical protein